MLEEALIAKDLEIEAAKEAATAVQADLAIYEANQLERNPELAQWIERLRDSRIQLLQQNTSIVNLETKCSEREAQVAQASIKLEAALNDRDAAAADAAMMRETMAMDVTCLEDAVAATLMDKEEALNKLKAQLDSGRQREFELQMSLDTVTLTAVSVQEQLDGYNQAINVACQGPDSAQIEGLAAQLLVAKSQQEDASDQLREQSQRHHDEVTMMKETISTLEQQLANLQADVSQAGEMQQWVDNMGVEREAAEEAAQKMDELLKAEQMKEKISLISEAHRVSESRIRQLQKSFEDKYTTRAHLQADVVLLSVSGQPGEGQTMVDEEIFKIRNESDQVRKNNQSLLQVYVMLQHVIL